MFKAALLFAVLLVLPAFLFAQTAAEMEKLLDAQAVTYQEAAWFVINAADTFAPANPAEAYRLSVEQQWLPKDTSAQSSASLKDISLLIMNAFDIKGGFFYSRFKNPHYAYRELVYKDIIQIRSDPEMLISGSDLLFMLNRTIALFEEDFEFGPDGEPRNITAAAIEEKQETQRLPKEETQPEMVVAQIEEPRQRIIDELNASLLPLYFPQDSTTLSSAELKKLRDIGKKLKSASVTKIQVNGYTNPAGTETWLAKLSLDRAKAVASFLVLLGVCAKEDIIVRGMGTENLIGDITTERGRALNRRAEIIVLEISDEDAL